MITYHTQNINRKTYSQIIYQHVIDHLQVVTDPEARDRLLTETMNDQIHIWPTTELPNWLASRNLTSWGYSSNPFPKGTKINYMIPHEMVGKEEMHLFIVDINNTAYDPSNIMALTHGLGHVMLKAIAPFREGNLLVNDLSGNKAGIKGKWFMTAVHNRTNTKGNTYLLKIYRLFKKWMPKEYYAFDFRKDLSQF